VKNIGVFSVRDLRNHSSRLMKDAEQGHISLITKRGKPTVLAVPFSEQTLRLGIEKDMALELFQTGALTLVKAARIAGVPVVEFMDILSRLEITVVDYPAEELADEVQL